MRGRSVLAAVGAAAVLFAAFWLVALTGECGGMGGCISTARVAGVTYTISLARKMAIEPPMLARYAAVERRSDGHATLDETAYRLGELDPARVLVVKLAPGQVDDAGSIGDYLLLVRDAAAWSLTCPYFASNDATRPEVCP
jgi:hypothetical protein